MATHFQPETGEQLRDCLRDAAASRKSIALFGSNSKAALGGAGQATDVTVSTASLRRILQYEPADLTLSVEAGMPFAELQAVLAAKGQMLPLDGVFAGQGTVGGIVAANLSGPKRRAYGTARDLVIGMRFATLDGRLADTGGMVVKNVAGLDVAKLLIGSYGTLAGIVSVNFKVLPKPVETRTFLVPVATLEEARAFSASLLASQWNPAAVEVLNPALSRELRLNGYTVAVAFSGNLALMSRLGREMERAGSPLAIVGEDEVLFWQSLQLVTPKFLEQYGGASVVRVHTPVSETLGPLELAGDAVLGQSGNGIARVWFEDCERAKAFLAKAAPQNWQVVVEAATLRAKTELTLWPKPGGDFAIMEQVKRMFDPHGLLNSGRLYNRI